MSDWEPLDRLPDCPVSESEGVFRALLWGRLHVRGTGSAWTTDWKVLKAAWVRWTGSGVNGSAKDAQNWWHHDDAGARISRIEATHYMPLPEGPADGPRTERESANSADEAAN